MLGKADWRSAQSDPPPATVRRPPASVIRPRGVADPSQERLNQAEVTSLHGKGVIFFARL